MPVGNKGAAAKCPRCFSHPSLCFCALIRPVRTRTRYVVVRHALEDSKQSNTARAAALCLVNSELRPYGSKGTPTRLDDLPRPGTWLLFPGPQPHVPEGPRPECVVVLDGSWAQVRRMQLRLEDLRGLPRLSLPVPEGRRSLRRAPEGGMSTLEALARCIELLDGPREAEAIDELHGVLVERVLRSRGYL